MTTLSPRALPPLAALALAAALTALLLGGLAAPPAARAQVDPAAADGLGSIAGTVVDENGTPLAGMQVDFYVYDNAQNSLEGWSSVATMNTGASGRYTAALTPGIYRVRFSDPAAIYGLQFYNDALTIKSAQDVVVAGNAVNGVNARLETGGSITGALRPGNLGYVTADDVAAYTFAAGEWQEVRRGTAEHVGTYRIEGLRPGTYRVCLISNLYLAYNIAPCYDHISGGVNYAVDVAVGAGEVISGIDVVGRDFVDYATISGTVTSEDHTPLPGIRVTAWTNAVYSTTTDTDAAGTYRLAVAASGEIQVQFSNPDGLYQGQWFDGSTVTDATSLELEPFQVRSGVDAVLALGGSITGTWSDHGGYASIFAFDVPTQNIVQETGNRVTPAYQLGGLPPGVYRVCGQRLVPYLLYVLTCYPGDVPFEAAANITVTAGSTVANIDRLDRVEPPGGAVLAGTVVGPDLKPLPGMYVDLLHWRSPGDVVPPELNADIASTATGADGAYRFEGLDDGKYTVRAYDPAGVYATTYYSHTPWSALGEIIEVKHGAAPILSPVQLPIGGAISGVVQRANGQRVNDAAIMVTRLDWDFVPISAAWNVDATGRYLATGLWPGSYRVCATTPSQPLYAFSCNRADQAYYWFNSAQPVTVTAGLNTVGVVITLGPIPNVSVFLPQIKR
ncbi:MAG: carboxypeptidase regulatory-like domain-containing protein [Caldilineaceae bacterium]